MSSTDSGAAPSAQQVGEIFIQSYLDIFRRVREDVHKFYADTSSVFRLDGDVSESASGLEKIYQLIMSSKFTEIEIDKLKSIESWAGGILVVVSGSVESRDFSGSRKFGQTFFLAPQDTGYFILNDVFQFSDKGLDYPPSMSLEKEQNADNLVATSSHLDDLPPVPEHPLDGEAKGPEEEAPKEDSTDLTPQEPQPEDSSALSQTTENIVQEPQPLPEEHVEQPKTYASILATKGKSPGSISAPPAITQSLPPAAVPSPVVRTKTVTMVKEALPVAKGKSHSVYVKNLPYTVTTHDIYEEFKNFGKIKDNGLFLRNNKDTTGECFAFVDFEDVDGVLSAVKASPIQLLGRKVYIEEKKQNSSRVAARDGRRGGRGRGGPGRSSARGSDQNGDNFVSRSTDKRSIGNGSNEGNSFGRGREQNGDNFRSRNNSRKNSGRGSKQTGDNGSKSNGVHA